MNSAGSYNTGCRRGGLRRTALQTRLLLFGLKTTHTLGLLHPVYSVQPRHPVFRKDLNLWLQHRSMQTVIVYRSASHESGSRSDRALSKHDCSARLAERVGHLPSSGYGLRLRKYSQVVLAPCETSVRIQGSEVRREHGRRHFSTICAMAHEGVDQTGSLDRLDF
jgi:hypothetical protein